MDVVEGKIKCQGPLTWDPLKGMDPKFLNQTMYKESIINVDYKLFDDHRILHHQLKDLTVEI